MAVLAEQGVDHVWLDVSGLEDFAHRFPTITAVLRGLGLDPERDWLPVAPAAHYLCGGIVADLEGATSLPGLWVAGEAACNGVHGANRLASNSLLDGMVFGPRVVEAVGSGLDGPRVTNAAESRANAARILSRSSVATDRRLPQGGPGCPHEARAVALASRPGFGDAIRRGWMARGITTWMRPGDASDR